MAALWAAGLLGFYVLFFDAPYFLRRYLFPLSPFLALLWGGVAERAGRRLAASRMRFAAPVLVLLLLVNFWLRNGLATRGRWRQGPMFQGVEWVANQLDETRWVAAFQSGTLGFFHDRTLNLDGKVNPGALAAIEAGRHQAYVVASPAEYVVDWAGFLEPWSRSDPLVLQHFEWVVLDREGNFAVLGRRSSPESVAPAEGR
jgi:hypothetical protein